MKKNKLIEQKLNRLAESVILDPNTVNDAVLELSQRKKSSKQRRWLVPSIATVCIVVVITFLSVFLINNYNKQQSVVVPYSLNTLEQTIVTEVDYSAVPLSELGNANLQQKAYSRDGKTEVVSTQIISVTEKGTAQITVYQDRGNGLSNFISYTNYPKQETNGKIYTQNNRYQNGEYYFYIYYQSEGIDYYITIMSPYHDATTLYFGNI